MHRATIDDQKNLTCGSNDQAFKEFDEDIGIDTAFFLDHETHVTARRDCRDQAHAVAGSGFLDDRRFASSAPSPAGVMIRAGMRCVAEIDFGFLPLRQGLDLRVLFLQPLLDQSLVALQGAMQRPLAGNAELSQEPPHRDKAQVDLEFVLDQCGDHLTRP